MSYSSYIRSPNSVVRTFNVGGNFEYRTQENHAYQPLAQPLAYRFPTTFHLSPYSSQPLLFPSPYYSTVLPAPQFGYPTLHLSHPVQAPLLTQAPVVGIAPGFAQESQSPAIQDQNLQGPTQNPVVAPADPNFDFVQNDSLTEGVAVDDDSVSVEAAS